MTDPHLQLIAQSRQFDTVRLMFFREVPALRVSWTLLSVRPRLLFITVATVS